MKKIIAVIVVLILTSTFCACHMSMGFGNFEFKKVHIDTYNYSGCFTVEKMARQRNGIEVKTKEAGSLYLSEGTYFLISDDCPFCDHPTEKGGD